MSDSSSEAKDHRCQNCGHSLTDRYCPACGQRDLDFKKDWRGLVGEYASSFLNIDGKIIRGLLWVLFRPGALTRDFLSGKRASQVPPLRFYLFASLLFFLWFNSQKAIEYKGLKDQQYTDEASLSEEPEWIQNIVRNVENVDDPRVLQDNFQTWAPRVFLLGVPILALATRLLFFKRDLVYLEHIVISMHLQTFLLLWITLTDMVSKLLGQMSNPLASLYVLLAVIWIQIYVTIAIGRIFKFGRIKAIASTILLEFFSFAMFIAGVGLVSILTVVLL